MLESLSDQVRQDEAHDNLDQEIVSLSQALDVAHVVYHSVNSSGDEYAVTTYHRERVDWSLGNGQARIDPVVQACLRRFTPVDRKQLNWSGKVNQRFMHEAIDAGVGNQRLSTPIRGPSGQFAPFTVSGSEDDETRGLTLLGTFGEGSDAMGVGLWPCEQRFRSRFLAKARVSSALSCYWYDRSFGARGRFDQDRTKTKPQHDLAPDPLVSAGPCR